MPLGTDAFGVPYFGEYDAFIPSGFLDVLPGVCPQILVELDYTNDPTSATFTWTNITPYVVSYSRQPVRTNEFDQPDPAPATITLRNDDGRFTPDNSSGPYYGGLKPYRRVRVRAQWAGVIYNRYWGYVTDWPQSWDQAGKDPTVTLSLTDALTPLLVDDLQGQAFTSKLSGAAINDVLTASNVTNLSLDTGVSTIVATAGSQSISNAVASPAGLIRLTITAHGFSTGNPIVVSGVTGTTEANGRWVVTVVDANTVDLQGSSFSHAYVSGGVAMPALSPQSYAAQRLKDIACSENGVVFANGAGAVVFHDRDHRLTNSTSINVQATIGDGGGSEVPYVDPVPEYGSVWPIVQVTPNGASVPQTATNTSGAASFFNQTLNFPTAGTYLVASPFEAQSAANYLAYRYGAPITRVADVTLIGTANTALWPTILSLDTSARVVFKRRIPGAATVTLNQFVEGYGETVQVGQDWRVDVPLSPADNQSYWILADSTYGQLGNTTRVYY